MQMILRSVSDFNILKAAETNDSEFGLAIAFRSAFISGRRRPNRPEFFFGVLRCRHGSVQLGSPENGKAARGCPGGLAGYVWAGV
jgi:hypothetical protein